MVTEKETKTPEMRTCPYCPFQYKSSRTGSTQYMHHLKQEHPEQTKTAQARKTEEERKSEFPPLGERLYDALKRVIPGKANLVDQITSLFNRNPDRLGHDRHRFRSWIMRFGLAQDQVALLEDELFGLEDTPSPSGGGQMQTAYLPTPGGGYQPIYLLPPGGQQHDNPGIHLTMPPNAPPPGYDNSLRDVVKDLEHRFERLSDQLQAALNQPPPPPPAAPSQPMRRIPILDDEGKILRDAGGQILYQEVPYDSNTGMLDLLKVAVDIARPPTKEIDEEKIISRVKEAIDPLLHPKSQDISEEWRNLFNEQRARQVEVDAKLTGLERERAIETAVKQAITPLQEQIREMQGRSGLTDQQFTMTHRENMARTWQEFLQGLIDSAREDMRPMLIQSTVASMRQAGVPDDVLQTVVGAVSGTSPSSALRSKIQGAQEKWLR